MSDDINIKISIDDSEVYRKLNTLRDSVQKIKDQLNVDLKPPKEGGLTQAAFKKAYGFAKSEHSKFLSELNDLDSNYAKKQKESTINNLVNAQYEALAKSRGAKDKDLADSKRAAKSKASFEERSILSAQNFEQKVNLSTQQHSQRIVEDGEKAKNRIRVNSAKNVDNLNEISAKKAARLDAQNNDAKNKNDQASQRARLSMEANAAKAQQAQNTVLLRAQTQEHLINVRARISEENRLRREASKQQSQEERKAARLAADSNIAAPSVRYAAYDLAQNAQAVSQAIFSVGVAAVKTAADYESAFTDIERTTLGTVEELGSVRSQLLRISETVPVAFGELSKIASIGAQLGLSTSDVAGFAKTVSEFSAASNVSAESAASAFGTIGELFNIAAGDYDRLGSAVAYVGVNSTATESQIISVTEAIAGVAASAGFSADSAVGLSGALASLKIPSEQARGALTRIFQEVSRSAAGTGTDMQNFANILGVSADQATVLAKTDMESFFMKFVQGLNGMDITTLTGTLDSLNLSDVRVANTLSRLAGNLDTVNASLADSKTAYADGTFLSQVYAMRVEDLNSKIQILVNDLTNMMAQLGESVTPVLGPIVDFLSSVAEKLTDALNTDAGRAFAGTVTVIMGVVGALSALLGVAASAAAAVSLTSFTVSKAKSVWAAHRAFIAGSTAATVANTSATEINAVAQVSAEAAAGGAATAMNANTAATTENTIVTEASSLAQQGEAAALIETGVAATGASTAVRLFKAALIGIPIVGLIALVGELAAAFGQASQSADIQFQNFVTDTSGLSAALAADKKARDDALAAGNTTLADSYISVERNITSNMTANDDQLSAVKATADFLNTDAIPALNDYSDALDNNTNYIGDNTRNWLKSQLMKSQEFQKFIQDNPAFTEAFDKLGGNFDDYLNAAVANGQAGINDYFAGLINQMIASGNLSIQEAQSIATQLGVAFSAINTATSGGYGAPSGGRANQNQGLVPDFASGANKIVLGAANAFKIFSSEADNATGSTNGLTDGLDNLAPAADGAAEKIYLLTDYANDLATIWERARDIRFSGTETLDNVATSFSKIAESTADAIDQIEKLNTDIDKLKADRALQEYFLSIAEAYGDTVKAAEIRAELAKIDGDLVKKNKDLTKAQDKSNKTLVGNSAAAIQNRADIIDLVSGYQDHIKALAASGMSAEQLAVTTQQLKADFMAQATQLGYNSDELGLYAVAFDDVGSAIDNVPRDVTVDFNGDPALTAIQEFAVKAKAAISNSGGTVQVDANVDKALRAMDLLQQYSALRAQYDALPYYEREGKNALMNQMGSIQARLSSGDYATGGYISGPGSGTSDSIPVNLSNGEYVIKAAAVQKYGVSFLDRVNQMRAPQYYAGGDKTPNSTGMQMVALSPEDRSLLRNAGGSGDVVLYANNEAIARSTNAGNKSIIAAGGRP